LLFGAACAEVAEPQLECEAKATDAIDFPYSGNKTKQTIFKKSVILVVSPHVANSRNVCGDRAAVAGRVARFAGDE
jgi:hypothetical protein